MSLIIPAYTNTPHYQIRVQLEGVDYLLRFDWSAREGRFYMSIYDQDETPLLFNVKVLANASLITRKHYDDRLPPGEIMAVDTESGGIPPSLDDFGERVQLYYFESSEDLTVYA